MKLQIIGMTLLAMGMFISQVHAEDVPDTGSPPSITTHHHGVFHDKHIRYAAEVATIHVSSGNKGPAADLVSIAYIAEGIKDQQVRPVMFVFNGGPISSSVYVHMLGLGPKRLELPADVNADITSTKLVDNHDTPLDATDLVFFDPAGTGYSRTSPGTPQKAYFSVDADADQLTQFIQAWLKAHGREQSPVFLFGESYGTLRAAAAAQKITNLANTIHLDGIFLQGQALNIAEISQRHDNIISYVVSLPTLAALGWYHGKVSHEGKTFEQHLDDARQFALTDYLPALFKGSHLDPSQRDQIAAKLEGLTGLPAAIFIANDLKVSKVKYRETLLKVQNEVLAADDGRYMAVATKENPHPNGVEKITHAAEQAFATYARDELHIRTGYQYRFELNIDNFDDWDWGAKNPFGDWAYMTMLKDAMNRDPQLHVVIGQGYYDTLTTTGASEYAIAQSGWPKDRVRIAYYNAGHMSYTVNACMQQMGNDLLALIAASSNPKQDTGKTPSP